MRATSSSYARPNDSSSGAPACQRYVPPPAASAAGCSMKETPFPLIVCATSAFGESPPDRKSANVSRERVVVVAVARADVPAEGPELRLEVAEREDLLRRLVRLQRVAIDDHPERPEPLLRGGLERLPVLALLELAVARHHDDEAAAIEVPLRPGDPATLRDSHPERARSSPRCRRRRRPGGRRGRRAAAAGAAAPARRRRGRAARRRRRARRAPSRRRTRRGRRRRSRARRRSAPRTGDARRDRGR